MRSVGLVSGLLAAGLFACGGGGGGDSCTPGPSFTLTISATGVSPTNACVSPGGSVIFQNTTATSRHVEFDNPGACPAAQEISGGQSANIVFANEVQCTYHVSLASGSQVSGTIVASTVTQSGGGY